MSADLSGVRQDKEELVQVVNSLSNEKVILKEEIEEYRAKRGDTDVMQELEKVRLEFNQMKLERYRDETMFKDEIVKMSHQMEDIDNNLFIERQKMKKIQTEKSQLQFQLQHLLTEGQEENNFLKKENINLKVENDRLRIENEGFKK